MELIEQSYKDLLKDVSSIVEQTRFIAYRAVNNALTIRNWHLGERIAREELGGATRAEYGKQVIERLAADLTAHYGKGFDFRDLYNYVRFYRLFPAIFDAVSRESVKVAAEKLESVKVTAAR